MKEYRCAFRSTDGNGVTYVNTFAVRCQQTVVDVADASADAVAGGVDSWLTTLYRAMLRADKTLQDLTVHELYSDAPAQGIRTLGLAGTLPTLSGFLPREVCAVLTLKSAVATRSGRGRMFIPGPTQDSYLSAPDTWDPAGAFWTRMATFGDALLGGHTFTEGVLEYHLSARINSRRHQVTYDVTNYLRRTQPHWLRSRAR